MPRLSPALPNPASSPASSPIHTGFGFRPLGLKPAEGQANPAPTRARKSSKQPYHKFRVLLALDGSRLTPLLLASAVNRCVHLADRLDILLVNPPKAPTSLLRVLLLRLEHSGIDYRLASTDGDFSVQVETYLQRFLGITLVLVDDLPALQTGMGDKLAELCRQGYRFVGLAQAEPVPI